VQDAFLKVFHAHRDLPRGLSVRGLVHAHSRERMLGHAQGPGATHAVGRAGADDPGCAPLRGGGTGPSPEQRLVSSERAAQISAAVAQLPERQRAVFTLCHLAEQTPTTSARPSG
jgi:DNA-directed RNA polymerase specialized sigma24 family protein